MKHLGILICVIGFSFGQNYLDALRPFYGFQSVQPLSMALGYSTVAAGQVVPGATGNPANYALQRFTVLQAGFETTKFKSSPEELTDSGLDGLSFTLPVHVYQGSLAFGGGITKELDFSSVYAHPEYDYFEEGGIYKTSFGAAVEFARDLFIGADFHIYHGSNEMLRFYPDSTDYLDVSYSGWSTSVGILHRLAPMLQIGAVLQLPTYIWADESFTFSNDIDPDSNQKWDSDYSLRRPIQLQYGVSFLHPVVNLFYQADWTDWHNLEFKTDNIKVNGINLGVIIDQEIRRNLRTTLSHHAGIAIHLPRLPVHLYGGYQLLPVPFDGVYDNNRRESFSWGLSYLASQQVSVQLAQTHYTWDYLSHAESYDQLAFGISLHF